MKKLLYILPVSVILIIMAFAFSLHSKAELQTEDIPFSLESQKGIKPSAYCINSDGTKLSDEYSYSGYFCIPGNSDDSINLMIYEGEYAYCIGTHSQKSPLSVTDAVKCTEISLDDANYQKYISALFAGTGENIFGLNETDMYYITQCALRTIRYNLPEDMMAFFSEDGTENKEMTSEYHRILSESKNVYSPEEKQILINSSESIKSLKIENNKPYVLYGPYSAQADFEYDSLTVSTNDTENSILLINQNGTIFQNTMDIQSGEEFYVMIDPLLESECTVSITAEILSSGSVPVLYLAKDDNYQDILQLKRYVKDDIVTADMTLKNENTHGKLTIKKIFEDSGVQLTDKALYKKPRFTIKLASEELYANGIYTDEGFIFTSFSDFPVEFYLDENKGSLDISGLPAAEYIISESKGAEGFYTEENEKEILLNSVGFTVTFRNIRTTPPETTTHDELLDIYTTYYTTTDKIQTETSVVTLINSPKTGDKGPFKLLFVMLTALFIIAILNKQKTD